MRCWPQLPALTELATSVSHEGVLGACDDDVEFAFGLDLILDGLERQRARRGLAHEPFGVSTFPSSRSLLPTARTTVYFMLACMSGKMCSKQ